MNEDERRLDAIRRVVQGESIRTVCADLGRSRVWYYKWRESYRQHGAAGLQDQRQPPVSRRTPDYIRNMIIETRDRLILQAEAGTHHLGIGARQIAHDLETLGLTPPPQRTIYQVLHDAGRTIHVMETAGYRQRPPGTQTNELHQLDLWPRILTGGTSLFLIHLVDVASWYPCGQVSADKSTDTIVAFVLASWQAIGVPRVLQLDNEMSFTGGRWVAHLGRLVRFALLCGCEVWFNPFQMPRCNAYVERFHGLCDQFCWQRHQFADLAAISGPYQAFLQSFRDEYRPESAHGQTPVQMRQSLSDRRVATLPSNLTWVDGQSLPLVAGTVHSLRRTDSQGRLEVLGRHFALDMRYRRSFIRATLRVADQRLDFYYQEGPDQVPDMIHTEPFPLPGPIEP